MDDDDSSKLGTLGCAVDVGEGHVHGCGHPSQAIIIQNNIGSYALWSEWQDEHDKAVRENKPCVCFHCWQKANDLYKCNSAVDSPEKEKAKCMRGRRYV